MILWQKQASAEWLTANEPLLQEIAPIDLAIISRPGRRRSLVEVICHRRDMAEKLVGEFGGVARPLVRNWSGSSAHASPSESAGALKS